MKKIVKVAWLVCVLVALGGRYVQVTAQANPPVINPIPDPGITPPTPPGATGTIPVTDPGPAPVPQADCAKLQSEFDQFGGTDLTKALPKYCTTGAASKKVINIMFLFAGSAAVLVIMIGGFRYLTSGGNPDQAKQGKLAVLWALAGLAVILLAFVLVNVITNFIINGKVL